MVRLSMPKNIIKSFEIAIDVHQPVKQYQSSMYINSLSGVRGSESCRVVYSIHSYVWYKITLPYYLCLTTF